MIINTNAVKNTFHPILFTLLLVFGPVIAFAGPGAVDTTFNVVVNNTVYSVLTQPDGKILIGGAFASVAGVTRTGLARLFPDGTLDLTYSNSVSSGGTVYAMLTQPDGKLLIGGSFYTYNSAGASHQNVARLNVDGSVDGTFTNSNPYSAVYALGLQTDGKVLIGGNFTQVASSSHYFIARLNTDGTVDNTFSPGTISGSMVNAIAVQGDGNILIGGGFNNFGTYGVERNNIARLLTNGTPDLDYQPNASSTVQSVFLEPDGRSVWGGSFTTLDLNTRMRVGRLNKDGTLDAGFSSVQGPNSTIYAVTEDSNDNIYVGGSISQYNSSTREGVARVYSDGTLDSTFNNTTNFTPPQVRCLAIQSDGKLLVGGNFTSFNSIARTNLVRLYGDNYPAEIVTQPQGRNVIVGTNVTFSVEVDNPTAVNYQWIKNGVDIPGAVDSQYSLFNVQLADAGTYSVSASTEQGETTSSNAVLQVGLPPVITQQPTPSTLTVTQGQTISFTAAASGTPLSYYWIFGGKVAGTNSTLTLTNVAPNQAGTYVFVASNFLGRVTSAPASLSILYPISIVGSPASQSVPVGGAANFSVTATGNPLNYQWWANGNPVVGATASQYTLTNVMLADAGGYFVVISNQFNSVTSSVATLTVGYPPTVTAQPLSVTNNLGDTAVFSSTVTGIPPITIQWLFNGNPLANQTGTNLTLTNVQIANIGNYALSAANAFGSTVSSNAFLNLNGYPSNLYFGLVAYYPFNGNANDVTGNGNNGTVNGAFPANDRFGNTNSAYDFQGAQDITFTNAVTNDVPLTQTDNWTISVWISPDVLTQAGIAVDLGLDAGFAPDSGVYFNGMELGISDGDFSTGSFLFGALNGYAFNSRYFLAATNQWHQVVMLCSSGTTQFYVDGVPTGATSTVSPYPPTAFTIGSATGARYFQGMLDDVRIYDRPLSSNDVQQLYLVESGAPTILQQPQSLMLVNGSTATFTVQATGVGELAYQWFFTNAPLVNATNPVLTLSYVQVANAGAYYVVVSNNVSAVSSSVANLMVGNPPQTLQVRMNSNNFPVIQMPGTSGFSYMLQTTTNLQPPVLWQTITCIQGDTNNLCTYVDTNPPVAGSRFYRISAP